MCEISVHGRRSKFTNSFVLQISDLTPCPVPEGSQKEHFRDHFGLQWVLLTEILSAKINHKIQVCQKSIHQCILCSYYPSVYSAEHIFTGKNAIGNGFLKNFHPVITQYLCVRACVCVYTTDHILLCVYTQPFMPGCSSRTKCCAFCYICLTARA